MASRVHEEYYDDAAQYIIRMHINVRRKVGVVNIYFFSLDRIDRVGAIVYIDARAIALARAS